MKAKFNVLVEKDEDGYYVATIPSLPGCHTQAKSLDDLIERAKVAIELYFEVEKEIVSGAPSGGGRLKGPQRRLRRPTEGLLSDVEEQPRRRGRAGSELKA